MGADERALRVVAMHDHYVASWTVAQRLALRAAERYTNLVLDPDSRPRA
jgi:hypothetical protein